MTYRVSWRVYRVRPDAPERVHGRLQVRLPDGDWSIIGMIYCGLPEWDSLAEVLRPAGMEIVADEGHP